jgi:hypothetical protein
LTPAKVENTLWRVVIPAKLSLNLLFQHQNNEEEDSGPTIRLLSGILQSSGMVP